MEYLKLIDLYNRTSKHSHYQVLAKPISNLISTQIEGIRSRYEEERLLYILKHLQCTGVSLADVGGNTGYFTMELIERGVKKALIIEGNSVHSEFLIEAISVLGWQDRVRIHPCYMTFNEDVSLINAEITLLLNVLHHVGADYGDQTQSIDMAKKNIIDSLVSLAQQTKFLVFQLGFNWKGNKMYPLFEKGTKRELIDFIESGVQDSWNIDHIGIAEKSGSTIIYNEINSLNIQRQDALGEFLNRPLFIMHSKLYNKSSYKMTEKND